MEEFDFLKHAEDLLDFAARTDRETAKQYAILVLSLAVNAGRRAQVASDIKELQEQRAAADAFEASRERERKAARRGR